MNCLSDCECQGVGDLFCFFGGKSQNPNSNLFQQKYQVYQILKLEILRDKLLQAVVRSSTYFIGTLIFFTFQCCCLSWFYLRLLHSSWSQIKSEPVPFNSVKSPWKDWLTGSHAWTCVSGREGGLWSIRPGSLCTLEQGQCHQTIWAKKTYMGVGGRKNCYADKHIHCLVTLGTTASDQELH